MQGPWERYQSQPAGPVAPAGAPIIVGTPRPQPAPVLHPLQEQNIRSTIDDRGADNALRREEAEDRRADREERARLRREEVERRTTRRPLSDRVTTLLGEGVTRVVDYDRLNNRFQDTFAGPGSGFENTAQSYLGTGTPGQRQFWADMASMDNALRNSLFGASLTEGERAAWERTTVNPNMTAAEVRRNLRERQEIERAALGRIARSRAAQGYDPDAIRIVLEDYGDLLDRRPEGGGEDSAAGQTIAVAGDAIGSQLPSLTEDGDRAVTSGSTGGAADPGVLPPEQQRALDAFLQVNPEATPEQLNEFIRGLGHPGFEDAEGFARALREGRPIGPATVTPAPTNFTVGGINPLDALGTVASAANPLTAIGTIPTLLTGGTDAAAARYRGSMDTATFGGFDEMASGGDAQLLGAHRDIVNRDADQNPFARIQGQIEGGFALPFPAVRTAEGMGVLARYAPQMRAGAAYSGAYGFGSGDGSFGTRATNAALLAPVGALAAPIVGGTIGVLGRGVNALRGGSRAVGEPDQTVIQAFQEEGVDFARPFADPTRRQPMRVLESTQGGNAPVVEGVEATRRGLQGRVDEMRAVGNRQTTDEMGTTVRGAVERRVETLRTRARGFYEQAERESAGVTIQPREIVRTLDASIANLERNPNTNSATLAELRQIRSDLVDDAGNLIPKTVQDIQNIREGIAGGVNQATLRTSRSERILNAALHAGRADVERDLSAAAPNALRLYQRGDETWSQMHRDSRQLLERLTGPADNQISGSEALGRVVRMMGNRGDAVRYRRVMSAMTADERRDFVATLMDTIGRKGRDEDFSPARFVTQTEDWSDEALQTTFGREGARSIRNLRTASQAFRDTTGNPNNIRSGLGLQGTIGAVANLRSIVGSLLGVGAGAATGGPIGAGIGSAIGGAAGMALERRANRLSAQALMNPDITRWMSRAARAETADDATSLTRQLADIARRNPAYANEIEPLVNSLTQAVNDNSVSTVSRAAASDGPDSRRN